MQNAGAGTPSSARRQHRTIVTLGLGSLFLMPWMLRRLRTDPVCFLATAVTWGISTAWTVREPYVWARDIHVS